MSSDTEDRLRRLEEHVGFVEHTSEQVSEEVAALSNRVRSLEREMHRLQRRLEALTDPAVEEDQESSDRPDISSG